MSKPEGIPTDQLANQLEPGPPKLNCLEVSPIFYTNLHITERKAAEKQPCVSWNRNKYLAGSKLASRNPAGQSLDDSTQRFSSETRLETNQTLKSHGPNKMCVWNEHILDLYIYIYIYWTWYNLYMSTRLKRESFFSILKTQNYPPSSTQKLQGLTELDFSLGDDSWDGWLVVITGNPFILQLLWTEIWRTRWLIKNDDFTYDKQNNNGNIPNIQLISNI